MTTPYIISAEDAARLFPNVSQPQDSSLVMYVDEKNELCVCFHEDLPALLKIDQEFSERVAKRVAGGESLNSDEIQQAVYDWAQTRNFTAPYGILLGKSKSAKGKPCKTITFGRARTLDCGVNIYNRNFIVVETNRHGRQVFNNFAELMAFLETL